MSRLVQRLGLTRYSADEHYRRALDLLQKREIGEAIIEITYAIEELPDESEYYAARGLMYYQDGVDDRASADFEQALKLHAYEMLAHYGLGMVAYRDSQWEPALGHFSNAYRCDPQRVETLYYLALTYHRLERDDYALQIMRQALALFAENDKRKNDATRWIKFFEKRTGAVPDIRISK